MKLFYIIEEAIQSLRYNTLRSFLTIIGIVVGIFSVTAMLALGAGLSQNILQRISSFSSGDITVSGDVTMEDLAWLRDQKYVKGVLGSRTSSGNIIAFSTQFSPQIGVSFGDYATVKTLELVSGSAFDFSSSTLSDKVALVDEGLVASIKTKTNQDITGGPITIGGQKFSVIGVMKGGTGNFGRRADGNVMIPYGASIGVTTNKTSFSAVGISLQDNSYYEVAGKNVLEALNLSRGAEIDSDKYFSVSSAQDAIASAQETTAMLSIFLGIVGGIALFVGGIGTMNMMLTTVTERTKEIGLRKATGARDRDIMLQILVESITLTTLGGIIGIALTYGVSLILAQFLTADSIITVVVSGNVVITATIVAVCVGVIFGLYPARNASKLQPVDALRAD